MSLALFTLTYLWMSYSWFFYNRPIERPPTRRTAVQVGLLTVTGALTAYPLILSGFAVVSGLLHIREDLWMPVHTGVVAGGLAALSAVGLLTYVTPSVVQSVVDPQTASFAVGGAVMAGTTVFTERSGEPVRSLLIKLGLRRPRPSVGVTPQYEYGETSKLEDHSSTKSSTSHSNQRRANSEGSASGGGGSPETSRTDQSPTQTNAAERQATSSEQPHQQSVGGQTRHSRSNEDLCDSEQSVAEQLSKEAGNRESKQQSDSTDMSEFAFPWEEPPAVRFEDIGGYEGVKESLTSQVVNPLRSDDDRYSRFDVEPSRGILLHGPPGTGKTLFARALANELGRPFVELTQADVTHEHINKGPQLIKRLFQEAETLGGVIFIDEAEQVVSQRGNTENGHAEDQKTTNMFLTELSKDEGRDVVVVLTTNQRDAIDDAILRSGRVDADFEIGLPDTAARTEILKLSLLGIPHALAEQHVSHLAERTNEWSGADLDALTNTAKLAAAERNAEKLSWDDLGEAYNEVASSISE